MKKIAGPVHIPIPGGKLSGELRIPEGATGLVIFVQGSKSPRDHFVADYLRQHGMGTLLVDLLASEEEKCDIDFLKERVLQVTAWVEEQKLHLPMGYFGTSRGAAAALAVAAANPKIRAIVSRGGSLDLVFDLLQKVKAPTLLIVGSYDFSGIERNQAAYLRMRCARQLILVPRATQLFEETGTLEEVAHLAAAWFYDCFASRALKKSA